MLFLAGGERSFFPGVVIPLPVWKGLIAEPPNASGLTPDASPARLSAALLLPRRSFFCPGDAVGLDSMLEPILAPLMGKGAFPALAAVGLPPCGTPGFPCGALSSLLKRFLRSQQFPIAQFHNFVSTTVAFLFVGLKIAMVFQKSKL